MTRVLHLLRGLAVGGLERVALDLVRVARAAGEEHELALFDTPVRPGELDFDPGDAPWTHLPRGAGVDVRFARRLARFLRERRFDVVHAHNDTAAFYAAAARTLGARRVGALATFHTYPSHPTRGARLAARLATARLHDVVAVSDDLGARLVAEGWTRTCRTVPNGVDRSLFRPDGPRAEGLREDEGDFVVGHLGRLDPIKRHGDLLEAFDRLRTGDGRVRLVLGGDGPLRAEVERAVAERPGARLVPRVHDTAAFLRALDAFVLCSSDEAAPLVLLEAMACGLPVVATRVGGVPELVGGDGPDAAALLVPAGDPRALADALRRVRADAGLRAHLAAAALGRAAAFDSAAVHAHYRAAWERARERAQAR